MSTTLITTNSAKYCEFIAETIDKLEEHEVKKLAIVALAEDLNITSYWNMSIRDKTIAEGAIRADVIDQTIIANRGRYFESEEPE